MEELRVRLEGEGWTWAMALFGGQTPALFLWPPETISEEQIDALQTEINAGRFGRLTAGRAMLGAN